MELSATLRQLYEYDHQDMVCWLTPGSTQPYWSSRRNWRDDYVVAGPGDFAEAMGWTDFCWEDMEDDDPDWSDTITIEVAG